jgi:hypothetical protein
MSATNRTTLGQLAGLARWAGHGREPNRAELRNDVRFTFASASESGACAGGERSAKNARVMSISFDDFRHSFACSFALDTPVLVYRAQLARGRAFSHASGRERFETPFAHGAGSGEDEIRRAIQHA